MPGSGQRHIRPLPPGPPRDRSSFSSRTGVCKVAPWDSGPPSHRLLGRPCLSIDLSNGGCEAQKQEKANSNKPLVFSHTRSLVKNWRPLPRDLNNPVPHRSSPAMTLLPFNPIKAHKACSTPLFRTARTPPFCWEFSGRARGSAMAGDDLFIGRTVPSARTATYLLTASLSSPMMASTNRDPCRCS